MEHARVRPGTAARNGNVVDLYDYLPSPRQETATLRRRRCEDWHPHVVDDWPERIPVTEAELDVIEAHFGNLLDELFGRIS